MFAPTLPGQGADGDITQETLQLVKQVRQADADMQRAITLGTGLIGYDLAMPAQVVVPIYTPVVNQTPRVKGVGVDVHHFKSITNFGWNGILGAVDENAQPSEVTYTVLQLFNVFQTIAAQNSVSFKAQWRGRQLEGDMKAKRMAELIYTLKLIEENWLITMSDYLWSPPTPLAPSTSTSGGSIATATAAFLAVTAINANGETIATQFPSSVTTGAGSTNSISGTIFTVPNATGYNIYYSSTGTGSTWSKQVAANFLGSALPTQPQNTMQGNLPFTLVSLTTSGPAALPAANSAIVVKGANNLPLSYNGILALIFGAGNQAYTAVNGAPGSTFTAAGQSLSNLSSIGINTMQPLVVQPANSNGKLAYTDLTSLLLQMWLNARANPDFMAVSAADNLTVTNLLANATGTRYVINSDLTARQDELLLGQRVTQVLNPTTGKMIAIEIWPFLPQGTIIFGSRSLPYPVAGFDGPTMKVITNQEYFGIDYPPVKLSPQYSFANFVDETLEISFLGGFGAITGIIPG